MTARVSQRCIGLREVIRRSGSRLAVGLGIAPRLRRALAATAVALVAAPGLAAEPGPLPEGPGADLVYAKCQQCHPISYVTASAGLPDFLWRDTLSLMKQLGMQVSEAEEEKLFQYLTTYLGTEPPPEPPAKTASDANGDVPIDGAEAYRQSCGVCHGPDGQGTPGAFPPLAGHVADLVAADRDYPVLVVLYGLSGTVKVEGREYNGVMPAWKQLGNAQIAALLNTLVGWTAAGATSPQADLAAYTAADIEAARGLDLSAAQVREQRPAM